MLPHVSICEQYRAGAQCARRDWRFHAPSQDSLKRNHNAFCLLSLCRPPHHCSNMLHHINLNCTTSYRKPSLIRCEIVVLEIMLDMILKIRSLETNGFRKLMQLFNGTIGCHVWPTSSKFPSLRRSWRCCE